jgi:hypothetical protein
MGRFFEMASAARTQRFSPNQFCTGLQFRGALMS